LLLEIRPWCRTLRRFEKLLGACPHKFANEAPGEPRVEKLGADFHSGVCSSAIRQAFPDIVTLSINRRVVDRRLAGFNPSAIRFYDGRVAGLLDVASNSKSLRKTWKSVTT
jgi:hypothetical protein